MAAHKLIPVSSGAPGDIPRVNVWSGDIPVGSTGLPRIALEIEAHSIEYIIDEAVRRLHLRLAKATAALRWSHTGETVKHVNQLRNGDELMIMKKVSSSYSVSGMTADVLRHEQEDHLGLPVGSLVAPFNEGSDLAFRHLKPSVSREDHGPDEGFCYDADLDFFLQVGAPGKPHFYHVRVAFRPDGRFAMEEMRSESDPRKVYKARWDGSYRLQPCKEGDLIASMRVVRTDISGKHPIGAPPNGRSSEDVQEDVKAWAQGFNVFEGKLANDTNSFALRQKTRRARGVSGQRLGAEMTILRERELQSWPVATR